ncbi:hypothetical protein [Haloferula sp. A504]|uniref:hypothetical protein n=1 Tax=Haloferula sp. A504 TaxID=3373601 RepID=UPI0031C35608|nr:hypothetical protein [Verrucomicrobiaceae bacterium E54]
MSIHQIPTAAAVLILTTIHPVLAQADEIGAGKLDELWNEYAEAHQALSRIEKPELGAAGFAERLTLWSDAYSRNREAAKALVHPLVKRVASIPDGEFRAARTDLKQIHGDLTKGQPQASHDNLQYIAGAVLPEVRDKEPAADRASLFAELTTPDALIREADARTKRGEISEPVGFAIQDTHALALARAGKMDAARRENDLLLKKLEILIEKSRLKIGTNHRGVVRTKPPVQHFVCKLPDHL